MDISDISFQVEEEDFSPAHPLGQAVGGSILKDLDNWWLFGESSLKRWRARERGVFGSLQADGLWRGTRRLSELLFCIFMGNF